MIAEACVRVTMIGGYAYLTSASCVGGLASKNESEASSPPETMSVVFEGRMCVLRVLEEDWWMRVGVCHFRGCGAAGKDVVCARGQKTAWPSVPAVRMVVEERKVHWVRQEVK